MLHDCRNCRHMGNDSEDRCRGCWKGGAWRRWEAADEESLWIPVTERLPDVYEDRELRDDDPRWWASHPVLALGADGAMAVCIYEINSDGNDCWSERISAAEVKDVRFWMPLPEPPEMEATIIK